MAARKRTLASGSLSASITRGEQPPVDALQQTVLFDRVLRQQILALLVETLTVGRAGLSVGMVDLSAYDLLDRPIDGGAVDSGVGVGLQPAHATTTSLSNGLLTARREPPVPGSARSLSGYVSRGGVCAVAPQPRSMRRRG